MSRADRPEIRAAEASTPPHGSSARLEAYRPRLPVAVGAAERVDEVSGP